VWTRRQLWEHVALPFVATRVALLLVGWLAAFFPASPAYPLQDVVARGWHFSPHRLLDIWGRWDTGWYMSIVNDGYMLGANYTQQQSNLTFFPLFPMTVRALLWLVPDGWESPGVVLLVGVLLTNGCLLSALILLYALSYEVTHDLEVARRAVLYLLLFPTAFFFSAFYTDGLFLLLATAALYAAQRKAWVWAAVAAALAGIARPLGVLLVPVLLWMALDMAGWRVNRLRINMAWLLLAPLPFLLYLAWMASATGDWLAPMHAQQSYFRDFAWPWQSLFAPKHAQPLLRPLEQFFLVLFLVAGIVALWRLPSAAYGLWVWASILPFLFTGTTVSSMRYVLGAVPVYIVLGLWGRNALLDRLLQNTFFAMQIVLMVAWSQFYFVG
jgi:MFS family permease